MSCFIEKAKQKLKSTNGSSAIFAVLLLGCVITVSSSLLLSASSVASVIKSEKSAEFYSSAVNSAIKMFRGEVSKLKCSASYTLIEEYDEKNKSTVSYLSDEGFNCNTDGAGKFKAIISAMLSDCLNPDSERSDDSITAVYIISLSPNNSNLCDVKLTLALKKDYTLSALFEAVDKNENIPSSGVIIDYFTVSAPNINISEKHYSEYIYETKEDNSAELVNGVKRITEYETSVKISWHDAVVRSSDAKGRS